MKTYQAPKILMHQSVEFGTHHPSNDHGLKKWCEERHYLPIICWFLKPHYPPPPSGPGHH